MELRVAPSAIDAYLREHPYKWAMDKYGIAWGREVRIPSGAGAVISPKLTPFLERYVALAHKVALQLLDEENARRRFHSQYELENPKTRHYDEAASRISNDPLKYIFQDLFDKRGGEQRGESTPPNERSESTDPHGGDLE